MTVSDLLSLPHGIVVLSVVIIALATFFFLGKIEGAMYRKSID